jgi:hypothetical protein
METEIKELRATNVGQRKSNVEQLKTIAGERTTNVEQRKSNAEQRKSNAEQKATIKKLRKENRLMKKQAVAKRQGKFVSWVYEQKPWINFVQNKHPSMAKILIVNLESGIDLRAAALVHQIDPLWRKNLVQLGSCGTGYLLSRFHLFSICSPRGGHPQSMQPASVLITP